MAEFLNKDNVELIWEIILDAEEITSMHDVNNPHFKNFFISQVKEFYQRERVHNQELMVLNKKFITNIIDITRSKNTEKNIINKNPELITFENIQEERQNTFNNEYKQKTNEFKDAIKLKIPSQLDFTEKKDTPIIEMEKLISQTLAQRNFDIEQINKNNPSPLPSTKHIQNPDSSSSSSTIKYIKIDKDELNVKNEVIDLQPKHVSWEENNIVHNIFSKLKLIDREKIDYEPTSSSFNENMELNIKFDSLNMKIDDLSNTINQILKILTS